MEYVYAAMMLHSADQGVNEENISQVLEAAGAEVDEARVKALTAALEGVDIEEAIESAAEVPTAPSPAPSEAGEEEAPVEEEEAEEAEEEPEEEAEEEEEEAEGAAGLGELFE